MNRPLEDVIYEAREIVSSAIRFEKIWSPQPRIGLRCYHRYNPESFEYNSCSWWTDIEIKYTDDGRGLVLETRMNHNCESKPCDPEGNYNLWCKLGPDDAKAIKPWIQLHWKICS